MTSQTTTANHPHNADPTAALIWENSQTQRRVYRVKAGYIATLGNGYALSDTFASQAEAVAALDAHVS